MIKNIPIEQLHKQFPQLESISKLKTGGQKVVYDALHTEHGKIVLKIVLNDGNDPRILQEIELPIASSQRNAGCWQRDIFVNTC